MGVQKAAGGKKPIRKTEKKVATFFFFFFFGDSKKFVGAAKNEQGGTKWQRYATGRVSVTKTNYELPSRLTKDEADMESIKALYFQITLFSNPSESEKAEGYH